jgi:hypothetical protein
MNPVFVLLNNNQGKKLSVKTLSRQLMLRKKDIFYFCFKDSRIRRVNGSEVGTGKCNLSVFTIDP